MEGGGGDMAEGWGGGEERRMAGWGGGRWIGGWEDGRKGKRGREGGRERSHSDIGSFCSADDARATASLSTSFHVDETERSEGSGTAWGVRGKWVSCVNKCTKKRGREMVASSPRNRSVGAFGVETVERARGATRLIWAGLGWCKPGEKTGNRGG